MNFNILPRPQVNGLIQGVGLLESIKIPDLDDLAYFRNAKLTGMVTLPTWNPLPLSSLSSTLRLSLILETTAEQVA